jgi:hypothetical protein
VPAAADILARLDTILRELLKLRAEVVATMPAEVDNGADDFADGSLIEISTAVNFFNRPADTVRYWCRQGDGKKIGGRWMASVPRIQRRLNGE